MKESVALAKDADAKKEFSSIRSDNSIHRVRNEPERQFSSLRSVIDNIRHDGGTPSLDSIATELSSMHTAQRASVLLALQRTHGNRYVQRVVAGIQAKLKVGQPGDVYEQEADRVAEQVMRMPEPRMQRQAEEEEKKEKKEELIQIKSIADQTTPLIRRQVEEVEEEILQIKEVSNPTPELTPNLESRIESMKGGGQPLPESVRAHFEPRFGYDFRQVRAHTNAQAAESAQALNAQAFTMGRDIVFGAGRYAPETTPGGRLLAHELTHVVQQGMSSSAAKIQRVIEGDITQMSITEDWARKLNDAELKEQIEIVRDQLPSLNSGSPEFETASSNLQILEQEVYIRAAEVRPIIEYILEEMLNNAASADVRRMHELNSETMEGCIQEWQDLPLLGQLLGPGPEECVDRVFAAKLAAMVVWAMNVRQGGSWDHKPHIGLTWGYWHRIGEYDYYYDIWSNIHYGYVGTTAGFSESALLDGAGAEQIVSTLARFQWPRASEDVKGLRAFDDPSDRASISIGIRLYETGATFQSILIAVLGNDVLSRRPVSP